LVAQAFQPVQVFRHSLERLCHRLEKLVGNDEHQGRGSIILLRYFLETLYHLK